MQMTFDASSSVTLLFDFWAVSGPPGMVLSVLVVCLLTVCFEFLKMWRMWLGSPLATLPGSFRPASSPPPQPCDDASSAECVSALAPALSQSSLAPMHPPADAALLVATGWKLHGVQTTLHVLQVALSYMLMLCVMSYNVWIFLGVVCGAGVGYFVAYPLFGRLSAAAAAAS